VGRYLLRRLAASLLLLWLVVTLTFLLVHAAPGSPARVLGSSNVGTAEQQTRLRHALGLDRPLHEQYLSWLAAALRGDWGVSQSQGRPVRRMIAEALPNTLLLAVAATFVEYAFALPLGMWAARRHGSAVDHALNAGSLVLYSIPPFWLAIMAILLFARLWPLLPPSHMFSPGAEEWSAAARLGDLARHLLLPATVLGLTVGGGTLRYVRNQLLEVLQRDYVRTARAKGLSERRVVIVHGLRNAAAPLLQLLGINLPALLNGVLILEVVFSWPGLGRVTFDAISARDLPVVLATTTLAAALVVAGNLAADLALAFADPRVRRP